MCAILDANVVGEVLAADRTPPGEQFFAWLQTPKASLVIGGKLSEELGRNEKFETWAKEGIASGRVRGFSDEDVAKETAAVAAGGQCKSNDVHIIALARLSRARLLYSRDKDLKDDFKNRRLVPNPQGRLLPLGETDNAKRRRARLLNQDHLCPNR